METKALHINKAISTLPWLLLLILVSIIFLQFASRSPVNLFIISTTTQTLSLSGNKTIIPIPKEGSSSPTNNTAHEDVGQFLPLRVENITVGLQRAEHTESEGESCDLFSGKWVKDARGPIYTNLTCPTIPDDDNCWRYGKDQGYAYWRWKPDGCELQRFEPRVFLNVVRGKKMAFVGDSLARNHMESLLCLLTQALVIMLQRIFLSEICRDDLWFMWDFLFQNSFDVFRCCAGCNLQPVVLVVNFGILCYFVYHWMLVYCCPMGIAGLGDHAPMLFGDKILYVMFDIGCL